MKKALYIVFTFLFINIFSQKSINKEVIKIDNVTDSISLENKLNNYLRKFYSRGYLTVLSDSMFIDSNKNYLIIYAEKYFWGTFKVDNIDIKYLRKVKSLLNELEGKPVNLEKFNSIMHKIVMLYCNDGYPFVQVALDSIMFENNYINANIIVNKFNRYYIDSIVIKGDVSMKQALFNKILLIQNDEVYNEDKINKISERIKYLQFVKELKPSELEFSGNRVTIYTYLEKNRANLFNALIGIYPSSSINKKINITGDLNIALLNTFKHAEQIQAQWKRIESSTQLLDFAISIPYIFRTSAGIETGINFYKKDSSYLNIDFKGGFRIYNSVGNYLRIYFQGQKSLIFNNYKDEIKNFNSNLIGIGYKFMNINNIYNPSKGIDAEIEFSAGEKKFDDTIKPKVKILAKYSFSNYFPLNEKFVFKVQSKTGLILSDKIYENEMFKIGGQYSFRGMEESSSLASFYTVATAEIRFLFETNSAFYSFVDFGYYKKNGVNELISDKPLSFGVGLNMFTKNGIITIYYALIKQFNNPIDLRSSRIFVGFISRF